MHQTTLPSLLYLAHLRGLDWIFACASFLRQPKVVPSSVPWWGKWLLFVLARFWRALVDSPLSCLSPVFGLFWTCSAAWPNSASLRADRSLRSRLHPSPTLPFLVHHVDQRARVAGPAKAFAHLVLNGEPFGEGEAAKGRGFSAGAAMQKCNADQRSARPRASHAFLHRAWHGRPVVGYQRLAWLMSLESPGQLPTGEMTETASHSWWWLSWSSRHPRRWVGIMAAQMVPTVRHRTATSGIRGLRDGESPELLPWHPD